MVEIGLSVDMRDLQKRIVDEVVDGLVMYGGDKVADYIRMAAYGTVEKNLKGFSKGTIKVAISMIDLFIPRIRDIPYIGDGLGLIGRDGMREIITQFVDKPPYVVADDANTLHAYNFESTNIEVWIDGNKLTSGTDYTVTGTGSDMTINLSNALASGEHDIVVTDGKKTFSGKIKV